VGKEPEEWLDPFEVKIAGVEDPVAKAVLEVRRKFLGAAAARLRNCQLGDLAVDELYLYPAINAKERRKKTGKR
jgi:hypothetical protein